jgi:putrescine transport system substrate-binding protein
LSYVTANKASVALVKPDMANDKTVILDSATLKSMVPPASFGNAARESMSSVFSVFKKGG